MGEFCYFYHEKVATAGMQAKNAKQGNLPHEETTLTCRLKVNVKRAEFAA